MLPTGAVTRTTGNEWRAPIAVIATRLHQKYIFLMEPPMLEIRIAKLFMDGASQAVRLPEQFHFEGNEIYATRNSATGDIVLSTRPGAHAWATFFAFMRTVDVPADFMADRPMNIPR